jgi:predicted O-methyltransferase YrrM
VWRVLEALGHRRLAPGPLFCEWGSGFGVVAMLASIAGFDACGIEIEPDLVAEARSLARDLGIDADFLPGSFLPEGSEHLADRTEEFAWLRSDAASAYEDLGLDPEDFDVVFAYPWPGEEHVLLHLFDRTAADGALLVTYQGAEGVRIRRKRARRR